MKLYIVSNRLPVKVSWGPEKEILFSRSEGGLATGLDSKSAGRRSTVVIEKT